MKRDIDYAATAVEKAFLEKFAKQNELQGLEVTAHDRTIIVRHGDHSAEGTRDELMVALQKAGSYDELWKVLPNGR